MHRLDNPTRGLLIAAKTDRVQMLLGQMFECKEIHKRYFAVVEGVPPESGTIESEMENRPAVTGYRRLERYECGMDSWVSTVQLQPHTGRTHQLRKHMAQIGHPILGDRRYGIQVTVPRELGLFLCAVTLAFTHPISGEELAFEIPVPDHIERYLKGWTECDRP